MIPLIPQSIFAAIIAMRAKANVPFSIAACFISNPFTNVPFWCAQLWIGNLINSNLPLPMPGFLEKAHCSLPGLGVVSMNDFIVGFVALGVMMALAAYPIVHLFSAVMPHHLPVRCRKSKMLEKSA